MSTSLARLLALSLLLSGLAGPVRAGGGNGGGSPQETELPGEILVKLQSADALAPLLARYPLTLVDRFGSRPPYRLKAIGTQKARDLLPALAAEPSVLIAEAKAQDQVKGRSTVLGAPFPVAPADRLKGRS